MYIQEKRQRWIHHTRGCRCGPPLYQSHLLRRGQSNKMIGNLSKDVFERRASTGSEAFSLFVYLDANKVVLPSFFSLITTLYSRVWTTAQWCKKSTTCWRPSLTSLGEVERALWNLDEIKKRWPPMWRHLISLSILICWSGYCRQSIPSNCFQCHTKDYSFNKNFLFTCQYTQLVFRLRSVFVQNHSVLERPA